MNHGPDAQGPEEPGRELSPDELALRRMLHSAVDDVEPQDGTLEHLRRAVPARRARKRQAFVGMAAAVLFVGTAIPALIHVSNAGGTDPNTAMAGQSSQAQGGTDQGKYPDGGTGDQRDPGGPSAGPGKHTGKTPRPDTTGDDNTAAGSGTDPSATIAPTVPACTAAQLGSATASADAPDSTGVVYGTFRVTNVSTTACTVDGPGTVAVTAQGAADQTKLSTVRHVAGDPAAALPDPGLEVAALVLQPGSAYEEKFAFVPSETCPAPGDGTAGGSTGGPSPQPSSSQGPSTTGATDTGGTTGTSTQLYGEDGTPADGSITVSHTPKAGSPATSAPVPDACAGTVYYTGVLAGT
ncbi:hypothetical protein [Streptomyces sp. NPDC047028]|uniref:hypothetical protein n=1 Tax=Streptomyces sp. NPDC047028 TaxID=3155793 RepID=UPI0033DDB5AA